MAYCLFAGIFRDSNVDYIVSPRSGARAHRRQKAFGAMFYATLFRLRKSRVIAVHHGVFGAGFNLDEHCAVAVKGDNVNFMPSASVISGCNLHSAFF